MPRLLGSSSTTPNRRSVKLFIGWSLNQQPSDLQEVVAMVTNKYNININRLQEEAAVEDGWMLSCDQPHGLCSSASRCQWFVVPSLREGKGSGGQQDQRPSRAKPSGNRWPEMGCESGCSNSQHVLRSFIDPCEMNCTCCDVDTAQQRRSQAELKNSRFQDTRLH